MSPINLSKFQLYLQVCTIPSCSSTIESECCVESAKWGDASQGMKSIVDVTASESIVCTGQRTDFDEMSRCYASILVVTKSRQVISRIEEQKSEWLVLDATKLLCFRMVGEHGPLSLS